MKKFVALGILICMIALCPQVASAVYYTYTDVQLENMVQLWSNPEGNNLLYYNVDGGTGEYVVNFTDCSNGFAQVGIGDEAYYLPDMSGYEGIQLTFNNSSYNTMWTNLFVQTNEVEGGYNNFYDNTWTELAVGETITLFLDFSAANHYISGVSQGVETVGGLDQIFKWGFQIGSDSTALVHGSVAAPAPVPEPSTILLMGSGLLGIVGYSRKRFSKKS